MKNYEDCSFKDFETAMNKKNADVKDISTKHLYILYTKFKADASAYGSVRTSYGSDLAIRSEKRAEIYKEELKRRGISIYKT